MPNSGIAEWEDREMGRIATSGYWNPESEIGAEYPKPRMKRPWIPTGVPHSILADPALLLDS